MAKSVVQAQDSKIIHSLDHFKLLDNGNSKFLTVLETTLS